jgi:hypothetical protein
VAAVRAIRSLLLGGMSEPHLLLLRWERREWLVHPQIRSSDHPMMLPIRVVQRRDLHWVATHGGGILRFRDEAPGPIPLIPRGNDTR